MGMGRHGKAIDFRHICDLCEWQRCYYSTHITHTTHTHNVSLSLSLFLPCSLHAEPFHFLLFSILASYRATIATSSLCVCVCVARSHRRQHSRHVAGDSNRITFRRQFHPTVLTMRKICTNMYIFHSTYHIHCTSSLLHSRASKHPCFPCILPPSRKGNLP